MRSFPGGLAALVLLSCSVVALAVQGEIVLQGQVVDPQGQAIVGAEVALRAPGEAPEKTARTDASGRFRFEGLAPGRYRLQVSSPGFASRARSLELDGSESLVVRLDLARFVQEVVVSASMPELVTETDIEGRRIEEAIAQDTGEFLRDQPALDAFRRGPINLDPTLRGLQESQVAMFVDGTRTFAAGPARMDSDLSHLSPHAIQSIRVVKGPYALAWGAGTMSAIRLETIRPEFQRGALETGGRLGYDFGGNGATSDGYATFWGSGERLRFTASHNARLGNDYRDGAGNDVPADYKSFDTRWDLGFKASPETTLEYSGGYQEQRDLDYPGRILDATYFKTQSHAFELVWDRPRLGQLYAQIYANLKDHRMNNDEKPTARDAPGRVPPFGIRVDLPASSDTVGGRLFFERQQESLTWKTGLDFYRLDQSATRTISRRSNDVVLFQDVVWPDARIDDLGGYGQVVLDRGRGQVGATVRVDGVRASAGEVSAYFRDHTEGALDQSEMQVSAAVNGVFRVRDDWFLSAGLGRTLRTANALERYSDRFPSVKFQTAAEFLGNPGLRPERALEWNLGTSVVLGPVELGLDAFARTIDDYITVVPDPSLTPRLPLSPRTVYRYVNGEARFFGYELHGTSPAGRYLDLRGSLSYVWAEDETFDEPAFGIPPLSLHLAGRVHTRDERRWVELALVAAGEQTRVASSRRERPTPGWQRLDLRAGLELAPELTLRLGALNVTDAAYATHLNALDPFSGQRVLEVGRSFTAGIEYGF